MYASCQPYAVAPVTNFFVFHLYMYMLRLYTYSMVAFPLSVHKQQYYFRFICCFAHHSSKKHCMVLMLYADTPFQNTADITSAHFYVEKLMFFLPLFLCYLPSFVFTLQTAAFILAPTSLTSRSVPLVSYSLSHHSLIRSTFIF